jgi:hypothetical protein
MIRKSVQRFSEKIMRNQESGPGRAAGAFPFCERVLRWREPWFLQIAP